MKITIGELERIVKENYEKAIKGEPRENLLFECNDIDLAKEVITDLFTKESVRYSQTDGIWPSRLNNVDERGILIKTNPAKLGFADNDMEWLIQEPTVLLYYGFNIDFRWDQFESEAPVVRKQIYQLIHDDEFITDLFSNRYDMKNRLFTVAITCSGDAIETTRPLGELEELFCKNEVTVNLQLVLERVRDIGVGAKSEKLLDDIIASGFDIEDLAITERKLYEALLFSKGDKTEFIKELKQGLMFFYKKQRTMEQFKSIKEWIEGME